MIIHRRILTLLIALFACMTLPLAQAAAPAQTDSPQHVILDVPGMTCPVCPITVRKALQQVDGVIQADADFDNRRASVVFDPRRTDIQALIQATTNAGYPATVRQADR